MEDYIRTKISENIEGSKIPLKAYSYVSLFGKSSFADIKKSIFYQGQTTGISEEYHQLIKENYKKKFNLILPSDKYLNVPNSDNHSVSKCTVKASYFKKIHDILMRQLEIVCDFIAV